MRRADAADAATIARHRAAMFQDMGELPASDIEIMRKESEIWLAPRIVSGDYMGWLIEHAGVVVAGAGVQLRDLCPVPRGCRAGRWAHIVNVYTEPMYRRAGLARLLMETILKWCRSNAIDHVTLATSKQGRPLYQSLGFESDSTAMKLVSPPGRRLD